MKPLFCPPKAFQSQSTEHWILQKAQGTAFCRLSVHLSGNLTTESRKKIRNASVHSSALIWREMGNAFRPVAFPIELQSTRDPRRDVSPSLPPSPYTVTQLGDGLMSNLTDLSSPVPPGRSLSWLCRYRQYPCSLCSLFCDYCNHPYPATTLRHHMQRLPLQRCASYLQRLFFPARRLVSSSVLPACRRQSHGNRSATVPNPPPTLPQTEPGAGASRAWSALAGLFRLSSSTPTPVAPSRIGIPRNHAPLTLQRTLSFFPSASLHFP